MIIWKTFAMRSVIYRCGGKGVGPPGPGVGPLFGGAALGPPPPKKAGGGRGPPPRGAPSSGTRRRAPARGQRGRRRWTAGPLDRHWSRSCLGTPPTVTRSRDPAGRSCVALRVEEESMAVPVVNALVGGGGGPAGRGRAQHGRAGGPSAVCAPQ